MNVDAWAPGRLGKDLRTTRRPIGLDLTEVDEDRIYQSRVDTRNNKSHHMSWLANLWLDDQNIIREPPLGGALDRLRDALQTTEDSYQSNPNSHDEQGPNWHSVRSTSDDGILCSIASFISLASNKLFATFLSSDSAL